MPRVRLRRARSHRCGTQRLETELERRLPELERFRLDADVSSRGGAVRDVLERFGSADRAVLVGTQMVAKGHHLPGVALAAVVDADTGLALPDFRAEERTFQLVTQLAGRSGRDAPGRVLVQTFQPDATPPGTRSTTTSPGSSRASSSAARSSATRPSATSSRSSSPAPSRAPRSRRCASCGAPRERTGSTRCCSAGAGAPAARAPQGAADREDDAAPSARAGHRRSSRRQRERCGGTGLTAVVDVDPQSL